MTDAMGAAKEQGLADRIRAPGFAGMNRQVEQVVASIVKRTEMMFGRVTGFTAGEVKSRDAFVLVLNG